MSTSSLPYTIHASEYEIQAIRARGPGGQHVNKVSSAVHLRFDIEKSSLCEIFKTRLMSLRDQRITRDGILVIKSQQFRSFERNKEEAVRRMLRIIETVCAEPLPRKPTRPSRSAIKKRLLSKSRRSTIKLTRQSDFHFND
jgi:ribosome-associated protein